MFEPLELTQAITAVICRFENDKHSAQQKGIISSFSLCLIRLFLEFKSAFSFLKALRILYTVPKTD